MIGITSYGAYIPRLRLSRTAIVQHMGWFAPAIMMVAQGERAICNWDEDAVTMAVAASRDCLIGMDKQTIDGLYLASTTLPFADRQNAGIVSTALNLREDIITSDFTSSQKAGATALIAALEAIKSGEKKDILVTAADRRETRTAYFYEMWFGDGAASLSVGDTDVIASYLGSYSISCDFVDHYRGAAKKFDYVWEERWARDAGYSRIIPEAVGGLLQRLGMSMQQVDKLIFPCIFKAEHQKIAKSLGASPDQIVDTFHEICGETGTAHPLLMLVRALESASPGQKIVMVGFGQGASALCFEVTDAIKKLEKRSGFAGSMENRKITDNYMKWLKFRELVEPETGIRAEAPTQTATTVLWRKRRMLLGFAGGKCRICGTPQFPKMDICVNPECGALRSQDDYEFADRPAVIKTFTGDLLAVSVDPPHCYGIVQFEGGGRLLADFTDCAYEDLAVGLPVKMVFRRRSADPVRGFVNYFWKAAPVFGAGAAAPAVRFDGRVAVVTGAGAGLGRIYALELARRGAAVVVNDLGGARDGFGNGSTSPADTVVEEIKNIGGQAVASYDSVATADGGDRIVRTALDAFGRIDILINNAGILRDKSIVNMEPENWKAVMDVHLNGAFHVTRPAMEAMKKNGYGRIILTSSAAGLYGNFGQTNYSAAKMALIGFMNTLKIEGKKYNIQVNAIAPIAASRLTEDVMPPELFERSKPEAVAPIVLFLCSESCRETGGIFNAGMGHFSRTAILTGRSVSLGGPDHPPTVERIAENWNRIDNLEGAEEMPDANAAIFALIAPPGAEPASKTGAGSSSLDVQAIFDKMPSAFRPEAAEGIHVTFQYDISGPAGGSWTVEVSDGACRIEKASAQRPTCTLKIADTDFIDMVEGKLNPMQAFTSGRLKIEGDVMKSQLIEKLFPLGSG